MVNLRSIKKNLPGDNEKNQSPEKSNPDSSNQEEKGLTNLRKKQPEEKSNEKQEENHTDENENFGPRVIRINQLKSSGFTGRKEVIKDHLPIGLTLLAGAPKIGKSRFAFSLVVDVCLGRKALGKLPSNPYPSIYLAYEETLEDLYEKTQIALANRDLDSDYDLNLHIMADMRDIEESSLAETIQDIVIQNKIKLIVVDPLGRAVKNNALIKAHSYMNDYEFLGELQHIALDFGVAIIVVCHTRKTASDNPMDSILGSRGVTAPADSTWVIHNKHNGKATLSIKGRNIKEKDYEIIFDDETLEWTLSDIPIAELNLTPERKEIYDLLMKHRSKELSSAFIAQELNKDQANISQMLRKMVLHRIIKKGGKYGYYKITD